MRLLITFLLLLISGEALQAQEIREVTFISDSTPLKGTLTLPKGSEPHPGVVLIHGSGPNNRNQRIVLNNSRSACLYPKLHGDTLQNFRSLATFFRKQGVATLRYDKRTYTHKTKVNLTKLTPELFIQDALAAVDYLKAQPEVASDKILVLGHSQGGNFLPIIAKQTPAVKGLIAIATPSMAIDSVLANQVKRMMTKCVDSVKALVRYEKILHAFEQLKKGNWNEGQHLMNAYPPFWRNWLALTDTTVKAYRNVQVPTLFLNGTADYNVPPSHLQRFQNKLQEGHYTFQKLQGVNHFLTPMDTPVLAESVKKTLATWLKSQDFIAPEGGLNSR